MRTGRRSSWSSENGGEGVPEREGAGGRLSGSRLVEPCPGREEAEVPCHRDGGKRHGGQGEGEGAGGR